MNQTNNRPTSITILSVIVFITIVFSATSLASLYGTLISLYGDWYGPFWIASLVLTLFSMIGLWSMKKWGVYTYVGMFVVGSLVGLIMDIPFTAAGLVVPIVISILGIVHLKKMT